MRTDSVIGSTNERTYHSVDSSAYVLPNDSPEHARLDMQARILEGLMYGDVIHARLDTTKVCRCLDIGCGTGYVTNAMARKFPQAEIIGLDLSSVPDVRQWEPNVKFFEGNFLNQLPSEWKAADGRSKLPHDVTLFDLCWSRLLVMGMTDWPGFFKKEFDLLKPGGWAECHEMDTATYGMNGLEKYADYPWQKSLNKGKEALGLDHRSGSHAAHRMKQAGFVDVRTAEYKLPNGDHAENPFLRRAGSFWAKEVKEILPVAIQRVLSRTGSSKEEVEEMVRQFEESYVSGDGSYVIIYVTYGRKPE